MRCGRKCVKRGDRDTLVTIYKQSLTPTANADGQIVESSNTVKIGERWAKVIPKRGRERQISDQMQGDVTHIATLVFDDLTKTLRPDMWITKPDGTRLNIVRAYDPTQLKRQMELELVEKVTPWV